MREKRLIALAASIGLVLVIALTAGATIAQTDKTFTCLSPRGEPGEPRIAFTGTLPDAKEFYERTVVVETLGNAVIAEWTDGLPVVIPTEEAVTEILTGTTHDRNEVMSTYSKNASGQYVKDSTPATFAPMGWQATVEKVAINAVMAGCKPEYMPAVLAMMSGGPNYKADGSATGYVQIVSGPYAKEIGINAGQGAMNPGNPPSMTIGRTFELCLINLGGAMAGSTNTNMGHPFNRAELLYAEDNEALPEGWVGMNVDAGFAAEESVIMLCQHSSMLMTTFAPSSFRALNSGAGGIANKLGVVGTPGHYNFMEYMMQWSLVPNETAYGEPLTGWASAVGPQGPLCFTIHPDMAAMLKLSGFDTKADFYQWVYDRGVVPLSQYKKFGWYDEYTSAGTAIEPVSGLPYNQLSPDAPVHVFGPADQQLVIISIYPGDESCLVFSGGKGIPRVIDPWR